MAAEMQPDPPSVFNDAAFRGRVVGVTGSAHGIGESTVKELVKLGASVLVIDWDRENLRRVEADLKSLHASALCFRGDVSKRSVLADVIRAAQKKWGRIDGWVNNAMSNPGFDPETLPAREFQHSIEVNLTAAWNATALVVPIMRKQGGGSIVNISSIMAHLPQAGNAAYSMAKAGIEGLTRNLAVDYAPFRIRFNAVIPGSIWTRYGRREYKKPPRLPAGVFRKSIELRRRLHEHSWRMGQAWPIRGEARDVADTILFLLSDAARFITGACIPVDGGAGAYRPWMWKIDLRAMMRDMDAARAIMKKHPSLRRRYMGGGGKRLAQMRQMLKGNYER